MSTDPNAAQLGTRRTLNLGDIKPYGNNPRAISEEAVSKVAESIERYGYQQPIVVDPDNIIIVGHTRHAALSFLGWTTAEVIVADLPEAKAREYRLADNKTGELSEWDHESLVTELREWETGLLDDFFPNVDLEVTQLKSEEVSAEDVQDAVDRVSQTPEREEKMTTSVECPECHDSFQIHTQTISGLSEDQYQELKDLLS